MKTATKRPISNETSQDRFIRFKDAATLSVAKISNKMLQKKIYKIGKCIAKPYVATKSSETSPTRASRLLKHDFESPESQNHNHRRQDIIKRKSLTTANETDNQRNERQKTHI
jgi:hypothetical protein